MKRFFELLFVSLGSIVLGALFGASLARNERKDLDRIVDLNTKSISWLTEQFLPAGGEPNWWCRPDRPCYRKQSMCLAVEANYPSGGCTAHRLAFCGGERVDDCVDSLDACELVTAQMFQRHVSSEKIHMCLGVE